MKEKASRMRTLFSLNLVNLTSNFTTGMSVKVCCLQTVFYPPQKSVGLFYIQVNSRPRRICWNNYVEVFSPDSQWIQMLNKTFLFRNVHKHNHMHTLAVTTPSIHINSIHYIQSQALSSHCYIVRKCSKVRVWVDIEGQASEKSKNSLVWCYT